MILIMVMGIVGCGSVNTEPVDVSFLITAEPITEPMICTKEEFDSVFTGRIVYADGTPYKRGAIKASGLAWESTGITADDGTFEIGVRGDIRFIFSAFSPYGDYVFYSYENPLVVAQYSTGSAFVCTYDTEILTCYEENIVVN